MTLKRQNTILCFPDEVLDLIFWEIERYSDIIVFSLTCKLFLFLGIPHIYEFQKEVYGTWAGGRLICTGDNASYDDLPVGFLDDDEMRDLGLHGGDSDGTLYSVSLDTFHGTVGEIESDPPFWVEWGHRDFSTFEKHIAARLYKPFYPKRVWVLANLSKRVYVRLNSLPKPEVKKRKMDGERLTLGAVLLSRICWSKEGTSMSYPGLHRGVWAGDRFVMTSVDSLEKYEGDTEWKDVSEEVSDEIIAIWKCEFGDEWMEWL